MVPGRLGCGTKLFDQKECPMEFKDYDFIRNPVAQNQVFFLESKCTLCGFSILTRSIEELTEHEKLHRTQCARSDAAAGESQEESHGVELQNRNGEDALFTCNDHSETRPEAALISR
jgi:hypothetical protein